MGFLSKLFKGKSKAADEALLVYLRLSDDQHGEHDERDDIFGLEDEISNAIDETHAGEFDGNEFGEGFCTLYMYGPSAARLWEAVTPVLRRSRIPEGSYAIRRFGGVGATEERVELPEGEKNNL